MTKASSVGLDLLDGAIYGAAPGQATEAAARSAQRYRRTPVFAPEDVPRGRHVHVGEGVWLRRCAHCDAYVRSYGAILCIPAFDAHLREAHNVDLGPLLPRTAR